MSNWSEQTVWWHVYPLGFTGAPIRPVGPEERILTPRLDHLTSWLDYMVDLGTNGLALGPIFESESHGYDTTDFFHIDSRLGDDHAFDRLVNECGRRNIVIMLDGVFNHVGVGHPLFQAALAGDGHEDMFTIDAGGDTPTYETFEGHGGLAAFNHDSESVVDLVVDVMTYWLRRGVSAWRLDAAYAVPPTFWAKVLPRVRKEFPDAWFVGEVIHGDYVQIVDESSMDSVTQYELWKAIWSSLLDGNFFELDWALTRNNELLESFIPLTFVGNHDVTRIVSKIGAERAALAAVILLTVGGIPAIYYGDEQAYEGIKEDRLGGDDYVRPVFPDQLTGRGKSDTPMCHLYRDLITIRHQNPWLVKAGSHMVQLDNSTCTYESTGPTGECLRVQLTLDPLPAAKLLMNGKVIYAVHLS